MRGWAGPDNADRPGISELETRLPVEGLLATCLTLGLWTPMQITATCTARNP